MNRDEAETLIALYSALGGLSGESQKAVARTLFPYLLKEWSVNSERDNKALALAIYEVAKRAQENYGH